MWVVRTVTEFLSSSWKAISSRRVSGRSRGTVAVGHQDGAGDGCLRIQSVQTDLNSAAGTRNLILINDGYLRVKRKHMLRDLIALVAYHNSEALRVQIACSSDSVLNHGSTTNAVHDLGGRGLHARTSACGENDYCRGCQSVFTGKTP